MRRRQGEGAVERDVEDERLGTSTTHEEVILLCRSVGRPWSNLTIPSSFWRAVSFRMYTFDIFTSSFLDSLPTCGVANGDVKRVVLSVPKMYKELTV